MPIPLHRHRSDRSPKRPSCSTTTTASTSAIATATHLAFDMHALPTWNATPVLSRGDSLRQAIQAAKPVDALQHICEHDVEQCADTLLIAANVFAETLGQTVDAADAAAVAQQARVRTLLRESRIEEELVPRLDGGVTSLVFGNGPLKARVAIAAVRSLAADSLLRPRLVERGVGNALARVLNEGPTAPDPATDADLALAAEALQRCALAVADSPDATEAVRARLRADGVEAALVAMAREGEDEENEGAQRRRQAASHALDALHGKLDVQARERGANRSLRRQLSSVGTDYASWSDERLLGIPRYNTFVSHKRSSAQDFARGLHSLIVHKGYSCFIDVENLESLSDLPMVVAGCDLFIFVSACANTAPPVLPTRLV